MAIDREQALEIAREDAERYYRDLSAYRVEATFDGVNWHVDYELADETLEGGGPHYVIGGEDGEIVSRRLEQ